MENFSLHNLNYDTVDLYKKCFDDNESPMDKDNLVWQFIENTEKSCFVNIAYDEVNKKTAGIYSSFCENFKIEDKIYLGTHSMNAITDIDYRGQKLFTKLAQDIDVKAKNAGVALVYGIPNGISIFGFKGKLGWTVLDPLPFLIKPLKTKYFTNRISLLKWMPNFNLSLSKFKERKDLIIKCEKEFPNDVNQLWKDFSKDIKIALNRDKSYLDWRYIQKPNEDYKIVNCYDLGGHYLGFVVYTVKEKHEGKIAYIMEIMYNLNKPEIGHYLMDYAVNEIKKEKADCILSWCFNHSPNYKIYSKKMFFYMPEKIRPIELHFGAKSFRDDLKPIIDKRENWFISYSDSDTV